MASVLLLTLPPFTGGVPYKARLMARHLGDLGHAVTVAYYATLSDHPELVATSWQMAAGKRPAVLRGVCFDGIPSVAVGCACPELEFSYYRPSPYWADLIAGHDRHIAVGGTVLIANPLVHTGVPHLVWCASTMIEDRADRRRAMPLLRRWADQLLIGPRQRRMERDILQGPGYFMTVSGYTERTLRAVGGRADRFTRLPIPIDMETFCPPSTPPRPGVIGFAGRTGDPRKNLSLLIKALAILTLRGQDVQLHLTGDPTAELQRQAKISGVVERIHWRGWLDDRDLPDFIRSLDVFAIPSFQEGLNIAGLQALACSVPVVSTRCGGPEDYVIDDQTGYLSDFDGAAFADRLQRIIGDRDLRNRLGADGRIKVAEDFSFDVFARQLSQAWQTVWQERP